MVLARALDMWRAHRPHSDSLLRIRVTRFSRPLPLREHSGELQHHESGDHPSSLENRYPTSETTAMAGRRLRHQLGAKARVFLIGDRS
jgi:hypothetical protein